jgi:hypothetical protein
MIWFIGGPARCGKSTLRNQARPFINGQVLSYDALRPSLLPLVSGDEKEKLTMRISEGDSTPTEWVALLKQRDRVVWKVVKVIAEELTNKREDGILEGNMWPDFMSDLTPDLGYRAVFLVDTSADRPERLISFARDEKTDNNWMHEWSDERIRHWATYDLERSRETLRLGEEHHLPVFDIADGGITTAQDRALKYLRSTTND